MPTVFNMMQDGVLTGIFPVGIKNMNIVFYRFDKDNPIHCNAYHRAGLKSNIEIE